MRTKISLFLMLLLPLAAQAQVKTAEENPEIRRYTIEMIVFKYAQDVSTGSEIFPGDEPPRLEPLPGDGLLEVADATRNDGPRVIRNTELVRLAAADYTMGETLGRLRRLQAYNPIMHFGWTQITWPENETRAINLASLARPPRGLDGELTLYLNRFLHLVVDLQLDGPGGARRTNEFGDITQSGPIRYRIQEDRILRSGELRYFDHPKFGVLAKVTRVEEAEEELLEDTELLGDSLE